MYNCVIVDDEALTLKALSFAINWEGFGFTLASAETSPQHALEYIREHPVDLLITDVSMPGMSGLELISACRALRSDMSIFVISAFSEFEYVHQAMKLGAVNYLLKPVDLLELSNALRQVARQLDHRETLPAADSYTTFRCNLTERWLKNAIPASELSDKAEIQNLDFLGRNYRVALFQEEETQICQVYERAVDTLGSVLCGRPFFESTNLMVCVLRADDGLERLRVLWREAAEAGLGLSAGISAPTDCYCVPSVFKDTMKLKPLLMTRGSFINAGELTLALSQVKTLDELVRRLEALRSGDPGENDLLAMCVHAFQLNDSLPNELEQKLLAMRPEEPEALAAWLRKLIDARRIDPKENETELHPCVQRTINEIRQNYSSDLSIKSIADRCNMSSTYLGRLFREQMGMYFSDFLLRERLLHARDMVCNTSMKMSEIARLCGFASQTYFTQSFKARYGVSPMTYRHGVDR